ncbi:MAG: hypothetical protein P1U56_21170 [Saprospiraceae bacterium]|nr:hypothetical protein [Saprospiraceae bacterium]
MKYTIIPFLLFFFTSISAQTLSYSIGEIEYKEDVVKTIKITLDPKPETIKDVFEDWMDDYYNVDLDGKKFLFFDKKYLTAKGIVIPEISTRKIDLIVSVDETEMNSTKLDVFASFGYNNWIQPNEHYSEFAALEGIVYQFVADYLPEYYLDKVEDVREELTDLKDNESEMQEELVENKEDLEKLRMENAELLERLRQNQMKINSVQTRLKLNQKAYKSINKRIIEN